MGCKISSPEHLKTIDNVQESGSSSSTSSSQIIIVDSYSPSLLQQKETSPTLEAYNSQFELEVKRLPLKRTMRRVEIEIKYPLFMKLEECIPPHPVDSFEQTAHLNGALGCYPLPKRAEITISEGDDQHTTWYHAFESGLVYFVNQNLKSIIEQRKEYECSDTAIGKGIGCSVYQSFKSRPKYLTVTTSVFFPFSQHTTAMTLFITFLTYNEYCEDQVLAEEQAATHHSKMAIKHFIPFLNNLKIISLPATPNGFQELNT